MSNFHRCASGWHRFRGGIADGRPGGRTPKNCRDSYCMAVLSIPLSSVIVGLSQPRRLLGLFLTMPEITFMLAWFLVQPFLKPGACGSFRR